MAEKKHWLKGLVEKYNALCKDLGVDAGACRGCVPVVKFDPEKQPESKQAEITTQNTKNCEKE